MSDTSESEKNGPDGPDRLLFNQWLSTHFIANNRTKTISAEKYDRICGYISGKDRSNAKFRYWVKSKGFNLLNVEAVTPGVNIRRFDGQELFIKYKPKDILASNKGRSNFRLNSKKNRFIAETTWYSMYRKVAVVEDFYDIIRNIHVDKYGCHVGQKQTFKMVSSVYAFLPREVVTQYLINCEFCKPRIKKYGNTFSKVKNNVVSFESQVCNTKSAFENGFIELDSEDLSVDQDSQPEDNTTVKEEPTNESPIKEEDDKSPQQSQTVTTIEGNKIMFPPHAIAVPEESKIVCPNNKVINKSGGKKERMKPTGSGRRLSYSTETDEKLLNWVKSLQDSQVNVTREMLQKQALSLIQLECPDFKASSGWVEKFLVRHGITLPGMCRSFSNLQNDRNDKEGKRIGETSAEGIEFPREPVIREPPNLSELLNNVNTNSPSTKDDDEDNDDDDDDDVDENESDVKKSQTTEINPDRLKAFNMFVRLFVDENLDRLVPISKQPKEKINAIILSCQRQFPEFSDRARKRIRTYLKSCRRSSRLKEPLKRAADNMSVATAHIPSTQLAEVNNIISQACYNESREVSKRARFDADANDADAIQFKQDKANILNMAHNNSIHFHPHDRHVQKYMPFSSASRTPPVKLSSGEIAAVRQLISGYRESAAFLYRSADELENLLKQSEHYYGQQQQQKQQQQHEQQQQQ